MSAPVSPHSSSPHNLPFSWEESTAASSSEEETSSLSSMPKKEPFPPDGAPYLEEETHYFFACEDPPFSCALRGDVLNALWLRGTFALQYMHSLISEHVVVIAEWGKFPETSLPTPAESSIALVAPGGAFLSLPLFPFLNRLFKIAEPLAPPLPASDTLVSFTDGPLSFKFHLQTSVVQALAKRHLSSLSLSNPNIFEILHIRGFPIRGPALFPPQVSGHVLVKGPSGLPCCQFLMEPFLKMVSEKLAEAGAEEVGGYAASPSSLPERSIEEDSCDTLP